MPPRPIQVGTAFWILKPEDYYSPVLNATPNVTKTLDKNSKHLEQILHTLSGEESILKAETARGRRAMPEARECLAEREARRMGCGRLRQQHHFTNCRMACWITPNQKAAIQGLIVPRGTIFVVVSRRSYKTRNVQLPGASRTVP